MWYLNIYRLYEKTAKLKSKLGKAVTSEKNKIYIEKGKQHFVRPTFNHSHKK